MRIKIAFMVGLLLATFGLAVSFNARDLARWTNSRDAHSGWDATRWLFWEGKWTDLGTVSLCAGLALVVLAFHHWIAVDRPERSA